jgi:hypothetical protein
MAANSKLTTATESVHVSPSPKALDKFDPSCLPSIIDMDEQSLAEYNSSLMSFIKQRIMAQSYKNIAPSLSNPFTQLTQSDGFNVAAMNVFNEHFRSDLLQQQLNVMQKQLMEMDAKQKV